MSYIYFTRLTSIALYSTILVLMILSLPGIPPNNLTFEAYETTPPLKLEGHLAPNSILNTAKVLEVDGKMLAPESVSIRGSDELFVGDIRGKILRIKNGKVSTVVDLKFPCSNGGVARGMFPDEHDLSLTECSYPLGTRFDSKGKLVTADAFGGLLRIDVDKGTFETLVARGELIEGVPVGFPEDLDIAKDGTIYWSDGTTVARVENLWDEMLGNPSGRLLKYDPATKKSTVLLNNIHFANGVQLSPDEDFVLVSESVRSRIRRVYLKGAKKGQDDIFIDGMPGFLDNIRSNNKGGFYVSLFNQPQPPNLGEYPIVRKIAARLINMLDFITSRLMLNFPSQTTTSIRRLAFSFAIIKPGPPENALFVELNTKGEIIGSLQSTNSSVFGLSQITIGKKYSYFGSPTNTKLWYIDNKELSSKR